METRVSMFWKNISWRRADLKKMYVNINSVRALTIGNFICVVAEVTSRCYCYRKYMSNFLHVNEEQVWLFGLKKY